MSATTVVSVNEQSVTTKEGKAVKFCRVLGYVTTTNPGTLVGPGVWTYDHSVLSGIIPPDTIIKHRQANETARRRANGWGRRP